MPAVACGRPRTPHFAKDQTRGLRDRLEFDHRVMIDNRDIQRKQWHRFWESASGFWLSSASWRIWLLSALLVSVVVLQLYVQFRLNYWNRDFFNALGSRNPEGLKSEVLLLIPLAAASILLAVTSVWGRMTVQRKWRDWMTTHLIDYWIDHKRYARLTIEDEQTIPEYRIATDARLATDSPIDFALGLVSSLLTAIIFLQVLWTTGGDAEFDLFGHPIWIPGYLVGSVIIYSGGVTAVMVLVGSPLTRIVQLKNQTEAELINAANLLRDLGEGVVPELKQADVERGLRGALQNVLIQWRYLCWQLMRTTLVSHGNTLLAPIIGLILCAPKFLAGAMTLGELTQAAAAFTLVQSSFNWLVDNYSRLADWVSSLERVGGLLLSLDRLSGETRPVAAGPMAAVEPLP